MTDMLEGIDVSDVQGFINWEKVKAAGIKYVFCKSSQGTSFVAKSFKRNWSAIKSAGFVRGAYHFCRTENDPAAEAKHFVTTVGALEPEDMLVLDIEDEHSVLAPEQFINWTLTFLTTVEELTGVIPIVYTGGPYFDKHGGKPSEANVKALLRYPLWLAAYTKTPDKYVPYVWKSVGWTIWQRSGDQCAKGDTVLHVPGINVVVDRNQYRGTVEELREFAKKLHVGTKKNPQEPINIVQPVPIDIEIPRHLEPSDEAADKPLKVPSFWDSVSQFLSKIFGIK
jgi:lysozyme